MPLALMVSWFLLLCFPPSVYAIDIPNITIVSCYDADTCRVNLPRSAFNDDWAYELFGHNIPVRVKGIDTPEIRGKCQKEKDLAYEARLHCLILNGVYRIAAIDRVVGVCS